MRVNWGALGISIGLILLAASILGMGLREERTRSKIRRYEIKLIRKIYLFLELPDRQKQAKLRIYAH